ncbi:MAG: TlpA disulfide reductase family protein, partial [Ilumatobacter sp.]
MAATDEQIVQPIVDDTRRSLPEPPDGITRRRVLRWAGATVGLSAIGAWAVIAGSGLRQDPTGARSPLIGKTVPEFSLTSLDGSGSVNSKDFVGRVLVVNFWASWCVPCREEAPELERFSRARRDDAVSLLGIVVNDTEEAARDFRDEFGLTYALAMDPGGRASIDFGLFGVP